MGAGAPLEAVASGAPLELNVGDRAPSDGAAANVGDGAPLDGATANGASFEAIVAGDGAPLGADAGAPLEAVVGAPLEPNVGGGAPLEAVAGRGGELW
jgi:hypothetical protein